MASPDDLQLEQKKRALQLKEESLTRQALQLQLTEKRIKEHQQEVAKKERANQLKVTTLIDRERKYKEEVALLNKERQSLLLAQQAHEHSRQKPLIYIVPLVLLTCIIAGYFTYEQLNKKEENYERIAVAAKNIDKLATLLSSAQNTVLNTTSELQIKKNELEKTKAMLVNLTNTTDQLNVEVTQLTGAEDTTDSEQSAIALSANTLSEQLTALKEQLEDKYLTIDINEAFIDYQENDLTTIKAALNAQLNAIQQKEQVLALNQNQQQNLKQSLIEKEQNLLEQNNQIARLQTRLETTQSNYATLEREHQQLKASLQTGAQPREEVEKKAALN